MVGCSPSTHHRTIEGDMKTLSDLNKQGYIIDEWERWQQGECDFYAAALIKTYPHLSLIVYGESYEEDWGEFGWSERHYAAHDDTYMYDSTGRHLLSEYNGAHGDFNYSERDHDLDSFGLDHEWNDAMDDAIAHAERHGIIEMIKSRM